MKKIRKIQTALLSIVCSTALISAAIADTADNKTSEKQGNKITVNLKDTKTGKSVGSVTITPYIQDGKNEGTLFTPSLHGLIGPSSHGFHIHVNPSCADNGMAAGGHWDPKDTGKHLGPYNAQGHKGDLPVLVVDANGTATKPVLAPKLHSVAELKGHSLMIHDGSDNYSDKPEALGGGGARMWCGVIS
jgi:Cu-Zn family superoxide dismutase